MHNYNECNDTKKKVDIKKNKVINFLIKLKMPL